MERLMLLTQKEMAKELGSQDLNPGQPNSQHFPTA